MLDKQIVESYIYHCLLECGFLPSSEEVETLGVIFIELLLEMGLAAEEDDVDEFRRF